MVFSSSTFLFLFLPIFFILYYAVPFKAKNIVLCIFSLIFYAWGEPVYIVLMVISSIVDYCNGLCMEKFRNHKVIFLVISIIVNLSMLGFFKYSSLLVNTFNGITGLAVPVPGLALPIGISFYTFQTMSYSIDVYRGKVKTEHNFLDFMAYVSMFPQLIAGPIVRYSLVNEELHNRVINFDSFSRGMMRFLRGLFKKVIIANSVGSIFSQVSATDISAQSGLTLWIAILAFSLQIYFDFSGYTDMAIGIGRMIGFTFPENFNYPYIALSVSDFWRRWHMSLTTWFRDYVYIPLGGSRVGVMRNIFNIFIVWALTGIWHGAAWNFMLWGLYFGVLLILEKFVLNKFIEKIPHFIRHIYVCVIAMIGWCIFSFESVTEIGQYLGGMFKVGNFVDDTALFMLSQFKFVLIVAIILCTPFVSWIKEKFDEYVQCGESEIAKPVEDSKAVAKETSFSNKALLRNVANALVAVGYIALFILSVALIISESYNPFLYFRF